MLRFSPIKVVNFILNRFRKELPEGEGFVGCIKNLTFSASGKNHLYDLGSPADGENFTPGKIEIYLHKIN